MLECVISGSRSDPWTLPRMQPQFSHLLPLNQNDLNRRGPLWNGKIYDEPPRNSMGKLHTNLNWNKVKKIVHFQVLVPFDLKTTFIDKWRRVQSRETGNIWYTRHMTNTNKTTQKTKEMSNSKMLDIINSKHAQKTIRHEPSNKQLDQPETKIAYGAMFVDGSGQNEQSLQGSFDTCSLPSYVSFG